MNSVKYAYDKCQNFFGAALQNLGIRTEVLWKGGEASQQSRFRQILRMLPDWNGKAILDVGCGFGDLYSFFKEHGCRVAYSGLDINEPMIQECRNRHKDGNFQLGGVLELDGSEPICDVSIASGIFMFPNPNWEQYVVLTVKKMFTLSKSATIVNFLSNFSQLPTAESHYADPGATLSLLMREISPWAVLLHDYRANDFTVGLFREPR